MDLTIGEKVKVAFMRSGYTLPDIQRHTGLNPNTLRGIFKCEGTMGSWIVICKFLNVELDLKADNIRCKEDDYKNERKF